MFEICLFAVIVILLTLIYDKIRQWIRYQFIDDEAPLRRQVEVPNPALLPDEAKQFIDGEWRVEALEAYKKRIHKKWLKHTPPDILQKLDQRIKHLHGLEL